MSEFKLAATLKGHEDDVRAVVFPSSQTILSASRDGTVRNWSLTSNKPQHFDDTIAVQATAFINSLAVVPPSKAYPNGLIASAGKDTVIDVREPGLASDRNAERLLLGHGHNVCTLDAFKDGERLVSGGWDKQARVWDIEKGTTVAELKGHDASVWGVLVYDEDHVITACADRHIRIFHPQGKLLQDISDLPDVVRTLCKLPSSHESGAAFASAGNDQVIRLWTLDGLEVAQLHGHTAFIYSLAVLPDGDIVSSGEDRTVRIWRNGECIQTITHPAISVWTVAACTENGDIVTGASDRIVRVFSRDPERRADVQTLKDFSDSVQASSIPQQTTGDGQQINKESLPGPDFLQTKSGTKEGQVQMIRQDDGSVTAHTWSSVSQEWINVGTVVDSSASSGRKITHNNKDYDYVFDVDIEDGKPPLKLPYNASQNPYEAAQKFIADNELPISYLDQVANFILQNTQGASLGGSSQQGRTPGSDPWGTENRYRPGEVGASPPQADTRPRSLPQTQYLSISSANLPAIRKKLLELNDNQDSPAQLNKDEISEVESLIKVLQSSPRDPRVQPKQISAILKITSSWPASSRLPALDVLRLAAISPAFVQATTVEDKTIVDMLVESNTFSESSSSANDTMMAVRTLVNLFGHEQGRLIVDGTCIQILDLVTPFVNTSSKNLTAALATLLINYAVLLTTTAPATESNLRDQRGAIVAKISATLLQNSSDSETVYRALVALGTTLSLGQTFREQSIASLDLSALLSKTANSPLGKEARIKNLLGEIKDLLA